MMENKNKETSSASVSLLFTKGEGGLMMAERLARAVQVCAVGERLSLIVDGRDCARRAGDLLAEAPVLLERAEPMAEQGVRLTVIKALGVLPIRPIGLEAIDDILTLARRVYFLPKKTWKTGHVEMIEHGLRKGVWRAAGLFDGTRLAGYLDCRDLEDGGTEIGFSMTDPDYRRRGLQKRLVGHLVLRHFDRRCDISSSEGNPTLKVLATAGFAITRQCPGERLDGTTSLYLSRPAWHPLRISWPAEPPAPQPKVMAEPA